MEPILEFFQNSFRKPIDYNFYSALEAILFLNNPSTEIINYPIDVKIYQNVVQKNQEKSPIFKKYNQEYEQSYLWTPSDKFTLNHEDNPWIDFLSQLEKKHDNNIHDSLSSHEELKAVKYRIGDILIHKLLENQRSFSEKNNSEKHEILKQNQTYILKCFQLLESKIKYDNKSLAWEKAINGKHTLSPSGDMFAYWLIHENNNKHNHFNKSYWIPAFDGFFKNLKNINILNIISQQLSSLELMQSVTNKYALSSCLEVAIKSDNKPTCEFVEAMTTSYIANPDILSHLEQKQLVKLGLEFKVLNFIDDNLKHKLTMFFDKFINEDLTLTSLVFNDLSNPTNQYLLKKIENFSHSDNKEFSPYLNKLILNTLTSPMADHEKQEIFNIIFLNSEYIKKFINHIHKSLNENQALNVTQKFVQFTATILKKEDLAYIISKNNQYIEFCKPIYLKLKLSEILPEKDNYQEIIMKKNKI